MTLKTTLAALLLGLLPTLAAAYCDDVRRKPDGTMCPADKIYDGEFGLCVEVPTM